MESKARFFFHGSAIFQRSMGNKNSAFETKLKAKAVKRHFLPSIFAGKRFVLGFHWKALYLYCFVGFRGGRGLQLWIYLLFIYIYNMFLWLHNCIP